MTGVTRSRQSIATDRKPSATPGALAYRAGHEPNQCRVSAKFAKRLNP